MSLADRNDSTFINTIIIHDDMVTTFEDWHFRVRALRSTHIAEKAFLLICDLGIKTKFHNSSALVFEQNQKAVNKDTKQRLAGGGAAVPAGIWVVTAGCTQITAGNTPGLGCWLLFTNWIGHLFSAFWDGSNQSFPTLFMVLFFLPFLKIILYLTITNCRVWNVHGRNER